MTDALLVIIIVLMLLQWEGGSKWYFGGRWRRVKRGIAKRLRREG